jgi:Flp pilus assembly protein CpaB
LAIPGSPRQYKGSALPGTRSATPFTILGIVLAIGGFAAAIFLGGVLSSSGGAHGSSGGPSVPVVVASHEIGLRTALSASDVTIKQMAQADVPPGSFSSVANVKGLVAAVTIPKDQPVTSNLLVKSADLVTGGQAAFLPIATGFVALTVPTSEQQGVAGFIQAGDYISIVAIVKPKTSDYSNVRTVFTNIHVLKVGPALGTVSPAGSSSSPAAQTGGIASSLTLVVTECQAEYINWFLANGSVKYALESYKDYKPADTSVDASCPGVDAAKGVTLANINQRFPGLAN